MQTQHLDPSERLLGYSVGNPHPHRDKLPAHSGMLAHYMPSGITLHVLLDRCSPVDVHAFRAGERQFGLLPLRGGYIWLMRDGVASWDAPYCPAIEPPENQRLPWADADLGPQTRTGISIILVDERRIVRALKYVSASPDFTRKLAALHAAKLAEAPASRTAWDGEVNRYFARYPNPKDAFQHAVATSEAGE
ncbi:MAG: hypothetical protein DI601_25745 [Azospirillum brasilense]|nr:MAG: hypothetical protein DI601_25745 [Azospirillum brasilense]